MATDETVGHLVDKVQALGTYNHVGSDGKVWRLEYIGECTINEDGSWAPFTGPGFPPAAGLEG